MDKFAVDDSVSYFNDQIIPDLLILNILNSAEIIPKPREGYVFINDASIGDKGFVDINKLDNELTKMENPPCFCFDVIEDKWGGIDITNVINDELHDWYDNAIEHVKNREELINYVNQWNSKQKISQFFVNERKIIILDEKRFQSLRDHLNKCSF